MTNKEQVIKHLIQLQLVKNNSEGEYWLENETIPAFGKTGDELIREGDTEALLNELSRIADGGYA